MRAASVAPGLACAMPLVLACALPLVLASCITFHWDRERAFEPPPAAGLARLEPGRTTLQECLSGLGAPLLAWEHGEGAALAWGWLDDKRRGISVALPLWRRTSAKLDYARLDARMRGVVLFFDPQWRLESWQSGYLRDLRRRIPRARPSFDDGQETAEGRGP
jgi:hypothetical protein